jgi:nucleotide-binding universal stress UspA family protein
MKVIIATDGSEFSRVAIEEFCRLFPDPKILEIRVVSTFVEVAPMAAEPFAISAEYRAKVHEAARGLAQAHIEAAVIQLRECYPGDLNVTTQVGMGSPERLITDLAGDWGADLIVAGSHGRGFWTRALVGSTSDSLVHHAPCSVLVVRKIPEARI